LGPIQILDFGPESLHESCCITWISTVNKFKEDKRRYLFTSARPSFKISCSVEIRCAAPVKLRMYVIIVPCSSAERRWFVTSTVMISALYKKFMQPAAFYAAGKRLRLAGNLFYGGTDLHLFDGMELVSYHQNPSLNLKSTAELLG